MVGKNGGVGREGVVGKKGMQERGGKRNEAEEGKVANKEMRDIK